MSRMIDGCFVRGHVIRGMHTEGEQLHHFNTVGHLETGLPWKSEELYTFCGHVKWCGLVSDCVIFLCDNA
jgi:hypothetical protein